MALCGAALVEPAVAVAPVNISPPTISGTTQDGETLTAAQGVWSGSDPIDYTYQWRRCTGPDPVANCTNIAGADASDDTDYTLTPADVGKTIRVVETATNAPGGGDPGASDSATSAQTATVEALPPVNTTPPAISGTALEGEVLTASDGDWSGTPPITFTHQWRRCTGPDPVVDCTNIPGADASDDNDYTLTAADVGKKIRVVVTADNAAAGQSSATSAATATVLGIPPQNTAPPVISGTAEDGQILSATNGTWTTSSAITYSYQWRRCTGPNPVTDCTDIPGADASDDNDYKLRPADVGNTVRVVVTATNASGSSSQPSAATAVVEAAVPENTAPPQISGTPRRGLVLSSTDGTWTGTPPITFTRQWVRCDTAGSNCTNIAGATSVTYTVKLADVGETLRVVVKADNAGTGQPTATSAQTAVVADGPTASFTVSPASPASGQEITLTSTSTPPQGGSIVSHLWDLNDDESYTDASGPVVKRTFAAPGRYELKLRVTDNQGVTSTAIQVVTVRNRPPVAGFTWSPLPPGAGEVIRFVSLTTDPDSSIASLEWDLDADGEFDDETGRTAKGTFPQSGNHLVGLRARDGNGGSDTDYRLVSVGPRAARLITPFPIVRIVGRATRRGARIRLLSVRAPAGSSVNVRCRGRGCPFRRKSKAVGSRGALRFRSAARHLRSGIRLSVFVTRPGETGKYTLFRIRKGKAPKRTDRCVLPGQLKPTACPAQ